jgi:hypothetical protein
MNKEYNQLKNKYAYLIENDVEIFCPDYSECGRFKILNPSEYWQNYNEFEKQLANGKKQISFDDFQMLDIW